MIAFIIICLGLFIPVYADEEEDRFAKLNLSADREVIKAGEEVGLNLEIRNLEPKQSITVNGTLMLPNSWLRAAALDLSFSNVTVHHNSSKIIQFNIRVPEVAQEGKHIIYASVMLTRGKDNLTKIASVPISVKEVPKTKLTDILELKLSSTSEDTLIGTEVDMNLIITNKNAVHFVQVKNVSLSLPISWGQNQRVNSFLPTTIPPQSSKSFPFNFKVPDHISEGKYQIYANVTVTLNNEDFLLLEKIDLNVKRMLMELEWDRVITLLLIYSIPGAAIERTIEALITRPETKQSEKKQPDGTTSKSESPTRRPNWFGDESIIKTNNMIIESIKKEVEKDPAGSLKTNGLDIALAEMERSEKERMENLSKRIFRSLLTAACFASIPAFILVYYGVGLLQILNIGRDYAILVIDTLVAVASITFITKPEHEIIKIFEKIRGSK